MVLTSKGAASARRSGEGVKGASYRILTIKDLEIKQAALVDDVRDVNLVDAFDSNMSYHFMRYVSLISMFA